MNAAMPCRLAFVGLVLLLAGSCVRPGLVENQDAKDPRDLLSSYISRGNAAGVRRLLASGSVEPDSLNSYGNFPLALAASQQHLRIMRVLIRSGASVDFADSRGETALMSASCEGRGKAVKLLLKEGAAIDKRDIDGMTALVRAVSWLSVGGPDAVEGHREVWQGTRDCVRILLANGADPNSRAEDGQTALHRACYAHTDRREVVALLLAHGADTSIEDDLGHTPLLAAAGIGHTDVFPLLLEHGADPKHVAWDGSTALNVCPLMYSYGDLEGIRLLLDSGAEANRPDTRGRTPLYTAVQHGQYRIAELLLAHGANPNVPIKATGKTPLDLAREKGSPRLVRLLKAHERTMDDTAKGNPEQDRLHALLLEKVCRGGVGGVCALLDAENVDLDYVPESDNGQHVLHVALYDDDLDVLDTLLHRGASVDFPDRWGTTPLMRAAIEGLPKPVRLLLERGALVSARDKLGGTALMYAAAGPHPHPTPDAEQLAASVECMRALLQAGADPNAQDNEGETALHSACAETGGHPEAVRLLLRHGAEADTEDEYGTTPLLQAASHGHADILPILLEHGADARRVNELGYTVLTRGGAIYRNGDLATIELLVRHGADVRHKGRDGITALLRACAYPRADIVRFLLDKGADVNACGRTVWEEQPLWAVVKAGNVGVAELLLRNGANVNYRNRKEGKTALDLAVASESAEMVDLLKSYGAKRARDLERKTKRD